MVKPFLEYFDWLFWNSVTKAWSNHSGDLAEKYSSEVPSEKSK